jgi:hypothetical protein
VLARGLSYDLIEEPYQKFMQFWRMILEVQAEVEEA